MTRRIVTTAGPRRRDHGLSRISAITSLLLVSACSSTPETVTLENGATGYRIDYCSDIAACELRAQQICAGKPYFVHEQWKVRAIAVEDDEERGGLQDFGGDWGGVRGGRELKRSDAGPWIELVIECDPPKPGADPEYAKALADLMALEKQRKRDYIAAVCELRDPDMRREELEIARQRYGDVSCP